MNSVPKDFPDQEDAAGDELPVLRVGTTVEGDVTEGSRAIHAPTLDATLPPSRPWWTRPWSGSVESTSW